MYNNFGHSSGPYKSLIPLSVTHIIWVSCIKIYAFNSNTTDKQLPPQGNNFEPATPKHQETEHGPMIIKQSTLAR
jgi:hypothetical protein